MSEQSGRNESSERPGSERSGSTQSGAGRSGSERQRPPTPASDMLNDLQRWLLRQSARSMGRELGGQVRKTLGGGRQQKSAADVWDTATNEIPPEVGESPECQWCPICRAARRMRDAGPGIGGQLSGAGDAVASVVQDAVSALDSILSRGGSGDQRAAGSSRPASPARSRSGPAGPAIAGRGGTDSKPDGHGTGGARRDGADRSAAARGTASRTAGGSGPTAKGRAGRGTPAGVAGSPSRDTGADEAPASVAGDHGPGGWKPGDKLATEHVIDPDPWAGATETEDGIGDSEHLGKDAGASPQAPDEAQLDGQGHEPDDRS